MRYIYLPFAVLVFAALLSFDFSPFNLNLVRFSLKQVKKYLQTKQDKISTKHLILNTYILLLQRMYIVLIMFTYFVQKNKTKMIVSLNKKQSRWYISPH